MEVFQVPLAIMAAPGAKHRGRAVAGELTWLSVGLGLVIAVVMTAANVYLGLYAGMTVSASIPGGGAGHGGLPAAGQTGRQGHQYRANPGQFGESLAAGAIFTIPALVLVGAWQDFKFWPTTLIAMCGGLLGIAFMVPLRRLLIVESPELTYPEGVACAEVLESRGESEPGRRGGLAGQGLRPGGRVQAGGLGAGAFHATLEWAGKLGGRSGVRSGGREREAVFFFGSDLSPALLSVGFITGLGVAFQVFLGGAIAWLVGLPLLALPEALAGAAPLEAAWGLWSKQIRYLGVGAMVVGGCGPSSPSATASPRRCGG